VALTACIALTGAASAGRAPRLDLADFSYSVTVSRFWHKTAVCVARGGDAAHGWRMAGLGPYGGLDWSPDGSRFAVALERPPAPSRIWVAPAGVTSTGLRPLTAPRPRTEDDRLPAWSPAGTRIAFARFVGFGPGVEYRRTGLWTVEVASRRERQVFGRSPSALAWSPGGRHLAVRFFEDLSLFTDDGQLLWTISRGEGSLGEVAWSPTGDLLAARFGRETLILTPERTPVATITRLDTELDDLESGLSWSPDGRRLALGGGAVYDRSGQPAGRYAPPTTWAAVAFAPKWSPDGTAVVFERARPVRIVSRYSNVLSTLAGDLYATRFPGGEPTALTTTPGIDERDVVFRPARAGGTAGTAGDCVHVGTPRRDVIYGNDQEDLVTTGAGDDVLLGAGGNDVLLAGEGNDVVRGGPGRDDVLGGRGNDRFFTRDGRVDRVSGGSGRDRAWADRNDRVDGVERIFRR
jgi:RTX calcium-binding nonapeptide repeat (4 copies)/WD40-like Beta Propeller Repeat